MTAFNDNELKATSSGLRESLLAICVPTVFHFLMTLLGQAGCRVVRSSPFLDELREQQIKSERERERLRGYRGCF